ncbi:MAG: archaeal proteasome endopeptidase complex subunit alpha [Candidatus Thorarchaeota archaeon]|nr:archaeal proteasome endopeptidase complex subunit alpha [Candidatus Thorarchaeota archaeon]
MFPVSSQNYDRAITMFSPEGRLYQVEYAIEAVRRGPLAVGVKATDGVVLVGEKHTPHQLVDMDSLKKILLIDDHVGTAISGLHADARKLIDRARVQAQISRLSYDEPISIRSLVIDLCDIKQMYTQAGGYRPFGVSLLVAGVDAGVPQLYMTDPSGSFWGYKAAAIGKDADAVKDMFATALEKEYKDGLSLDQALGLAIKAVLSPQREKIAADKIDERSERMEIGAISTTDAQFRIYSRDQVRKAVAAAVSKA